MSPVLLDTERVLEFPLTGLGLIEASAGTGKTYTIANLYLRHILAGREVAQVLVVTFTQAATDELRGRLRARLLEALECFERGCETQDELLAALGERLRAQGELELAVRRLRLAVRAMDEAAIYTIHGFCQRALTDLAFHSGQQFEMEVLSDDADLWRQAVADWWRRTGYPLDRPRAELLLASLGGGLTALRRLLAPLLGAQEKRLLPEVAGVAALFARYQTLTPAIRALADHWRGEGARLAGLLLHSAGLKRAQGTPYHPQSLVSALAALEAWFSAADGSPPPEAFAVLTTSLIGDNQRKRPGDPALADPFFARCDAFWGELTRLKRDLRAAALAEAAAFARAEVRRVKRRAQLLSFDDLLKDMLDGLQGPSGEALAEAVRAQFPVAMIDEFQDTDPVQYAIFRRLYLDRPECGLVMIGDPKQAIYSFRGGDIFTYGAAKADVGAQGVYTLATNWRSTPGLIQAVNALFGQRAADAFVYPQTIPFAPARPAEKAHDWLWIGDERAPALTLWTLPAERNGGGEERALSKEAVGALTAAAVAAEITRLIEGGRVGSVRIGERGLKPRDIAVLVRTSFEATAVRRALVERGVNATSAGRESVLASPEAIGLEMLLRGVADPRNAELARLALASPLLGLDYPGLDARLQGESDWAAWVDRLLALQELWQRQGFMPMFQRLLRSLGVAEALARGELAERRLTNLLHLGELLQQASKARAGTEALLHWLQERREEAVSEESELRLESDEDLVQIVTVHASKGLEYPLVFVPYLWGCRPRDTEGLLPFHRDGVAWLDAGSDAIAQHLHLAEQERLAEDVRLAYVALTRARCALYLVWGRAGRRAGHAGQTALAYLLHPHQASARLGSERPDAFAGLADLRPDLERLCAAAGGEIVLAPLPEVSTAAGLGAETAPRELTPREFRGRIADDWRLTSFSALTRDHPTTATPAHASASEDPGLALPVGSEVGSYLHLLLERLDFRTEVRAQVLRQSAQIAARFNLDHERWGEAAAVLLERVTRTALDAEGLCLAQIDPARRLSELAFDFATDRVDPAALDRLLAQAAGRPLPPLGVEAFRGMVTGVIDLVFEHQGRFYLADYKSNWLGAEPADYAPERLRAAVYERRYDLQYLLYSLALHRYLGRRLPGYGYQRHFGGVLYLFLRGMRPETGPALGVYFDRPAAGLVETLDREIFRGQVGGAM